MKKLFSVLLALVLLVSLSLVTAVPVSAFAGQVTYEKATSPGQLIADQSDPTALFKVELYNSTVVDAELTKMKVDFSNVSGFDNTDLAAVSVYRDGVRPYGEPETPFEPGDVDTLIDGTVIWTGQVAEVTFTNPEPIVPKGTTEIINYFWVAIETSATIANGDQFQATLRDGSSFEIDDIWYGNGDITTDIITAEALLESNTVVGLTGEVEQITAINVEPSIIDFGIITPGTPKAGADIYVENIGTVLVDVSASLAKSGTVFEYLELTGTSPPSDWTGIIGLAGGTTAAPVTTLLNVPGGYSAKGVETNILIFTVRPY